jgi:hypothetical protein
MSFKQQQWERNENARGWWHSERDTNASKKNARQKKM